MHFEHIVMAWQNILSDTFQSTFMLKLKKTTFTILTDNLPTTYIITDCLAITTFLNLSIGHAKFLLLSSRDT